MIASMPTHFKKRKIGDRIDVGGTGTGGTGIGVTGTGGTGPRTGGTKTDVTGTGDTGTVGTGTSVTGNGVTVIGNGTGKAGTFDEKLKKIYTDCETARKNNWKDDITEVEKLISSEPALEKRLQEFHLPDYNNLQNWRAFQAESIGKLVENEFNALHKEIYDSSKRDKKNKHDEFNNKVKNLKLKVDALTHDVTRQKITTEQRYHDLVIAKTWEPKKNKLVIPIILIAGIALILGIVFLLFNNGGEKVEQVDTDHDGIIDSKDQEKNTPWLADTSNHRLNNYIDTTNGLIDASKTKKLCDCWDFPDTNDRKILKCEDNLNWFVYEGKLYEFRSNQPADGKFYKSASEWVKSGNDDEIEDYHKDKNRSFYSVNGTQDLEATAADQTEFVQITYKGEKYRIKKGFTTDKGMDYNKANYRYKNNKWETQTNPPNGPWASPKVENINFLLTKVATEIKSGEKKKREVVKEETEKSGDKKNDKNKNNPPVIENKNGENTSADIYWIQLNNLNDYELKNKKAEIENSEGTMTPSSKDGKAAKKNVKTRIKYF
jgi:hypothetical protein